MGEPPHEQHPRDDEPEAIDAGIVRLRVRPPGWVKEIERCSSKRVTHGCTRLLLVECRNDGPVVVPPVITGKDHGDWNDQAPDPAPRRGWGQHALDEQPGDAEAGPDYGHVEDAEPYRRFGAG